MLVLPLEVVIKMVQVLTVVVVPIGIKKVSPFQDTQSLNNAKTLIITGKTELKTLLNGSNKLVQLPIPILMMTQVQLSPVKITVMSTMKLLSAQMEMMPIPKPLS